MQIVLFLFTRASFSTSLTRLILFPAQCLFSPRLRALKRHMTKKTPKNLFSLRPLSSKVQLRTTFRSISLKTLDVAAGESPVGRLMTKGHPRKNNLALRLEPSSSSSSFQCD
ncbi:hypothetical protein L596_015988 [Steinernema carpocapsae]|uniref:Uncharacterized protein n=1 Tax=Steinernema carpocapsae TaxID=34508 RepID=A0A4U5NGN8_STECR|nr:hypothetical protein L596_015988 [Steinernema carpocapsae]